MAAHGPLGRPEALLATADDGQASFKGRGKGGNAGIDEAADAARKHAG
jgi:hypothetical protein